MGVGVRRGGCTSRLTVDGVRRSAMAGDLSSLRLDLTSFQNVLQHTATRRALGADRWVRDHDAPTVADASARVGKHRSAAERTAGFG